MRISFIMLLLFVSTFSQVDYNTQIQPIFNNRCINCHGGTSGVTLTNYSTISTSIGNNYGTLIVVPFDAVSSPIYDKVRLDKSPDHGNRMPQGGALTQAQVDLIRDWINEGANEALVTVYEEYANPVDFSLAGNYPNPFNPVTAISFLLAKPATVALHVYDLSGMEIFVSQSDYSIGSHKQTIDFTNQPSGIYFYQISFRAQGTKEIVQNGKMTLLK